MTFRSVRNSVGASPRGSGKGRSLPVSAKPPKLPYGTCRLVVHSTQVVQTIYGSIQEYGGFDRPEWLD